MTLVKLESVNKVFQLDEGLTFQALKEVNLKIDRGEFLAIIGPSGSGKTTLMNILGLLDKPSSGKYILDGQDVSHLNENTLSEIRNKKIGFVFQNFNLLNRTTALENVTLPLIYSGASRNERLNLAKKALAQVGLADKLASRPNQLSGGQQQRVAIARALVTNPQMIFADEPTGNLDSKTGAEIIKLLQDFNKAGRTVILITHEPNNAKKAKRVIQMKDGKIQ